MKVISILLLISLGLVNITLFAQEEVSDTTDSSKNTYYLIKKTDGGEFYGYILKDDGREILLETKTIGKIYIPKSEIKEILIIKTFDEAIEDYDDFRETGPFTTRYYFTTNALPIRKKENYAMIHLYGPEVHFAVTDNISVGVMASWIASPIALALKYSFNSTVKNHVAVGTILGSSGYLNNARGFGGLHWLTLSHGDRKTNVSFSVGYGYIEPGAGKSEDKYSFQSGNLNEPYYVPNLEAENAIQSKLNGDKSTNNELNKGLQSGLVFGISGITPVGRKASFIFDSMTFLGKPKKIAYHDKLITVTYVDYRNPPYQEVTQTFTIGEGEVVKDNAIATTIILMPGMRFNRSHDKAIQVTLSGVININTAGEVTTFPVPMVSWLRQF